MSLLEERKRLVFPRQGVIDLPSRQINDFSQKGNRKKIELVARPVEDFSGKSWARMSERKTESPHDAKWQLVTAVLLPGPAPARQWLTISFLPDWGGPWRKTQGGYTFRNPPLKSRSNRSHSTSRQNTILHTTDHTFSS